MSIGAVTGVLNQAAKGERLKSKKRVGLIDPDRELPALRELLCERGLVGFV
jgi:hypothetical protein